MYAHERDKLYPEEGLLLSLADGERPLCRGVTAVGVGEYLELLRQRVVGG